MLAQPPEIARQVDGRDLAGRIEQIVDLTHRPDAADHVVQRRPGRLGHAPDRHPDQALEHLQVVLHAMVDFAQQHVLVVDGALAVDERRLERLRPVAHAPVEIRIGGMKRLPHRLLALDRAQRQQRQGRKRRQHSRPESDIPVQARAPLAQSMVTGGSDRHCHRKIVQPAVGHDPPDAIGGRFGAEGSGFRARQRVTEDPHAAFPLGVGQPERRKTGQQGSVFANQGGGRARPESEGTEQVAEILGVDNRRDHAGQRSVRGIDPPAERERIAPGQASGNRI